MTLVPGPQCPAMAGYDDYLMIAGDHLVYLGINREDGHVLMLRYEE